MNNCVKSMWVQLRLGNLEEALRCAEVKNRPLTGILDLGGCINSAGAALHSNYRHRGEARTLQQNLAPLLPTLHFICD